MNQELISKKDVELLDDYKDDIMKQAMKKQIELVEPHEDEIRKVSSIILNFIRENKRKIYGGYALNLLISDKNPEDAIYSTEDIPDIDFYSPDPLKDLINLCDILYKAGFKNVMGREAQHKETYSVRVNSQLYCDISYVPRNIYHRMPYREINGLHVIGPEFMMIDYYRMMTDLTSFWRIDKAVKRFYLLQKYYPLPNIKTAINLPAATGHVANLLDVVFNFVQNNKNCVVVGLYAYDHFLKSSGVLTSKTASSKKFKYLDVLYYEIIVTNYRNDSLELIDLLKNKYPDLANDIHVIEHYPFFQYLGYFTHIYYKDALIAKVFNNNKRCVPYITVPAEKFTNGNVQKSKQDSTINIGSYSTTILYALIMIMKARVDQDKAAKDLYYTLISHLTEMKNYYFDKTGKTIYDKTMFQEFIIECKGVPVTQEHERQLMIEHRKKRGKRLIFSYDPSEGPLQDLKYQFLNSSGNPIKTPKNLKLTPEVKGEELEEDFDEDEQ
jgi:hypothetical protein